MTQTPWDDMMKMKQPNQIFDLLICSAYFAGQFGNGIPVEESRRAFEHIKKLLTNPHESQ